VIRFGVPGRSYVTLAVFSTLGQQVVKLVDGEMGPGYHEVHFDGKNLSSGVYLYRLEVRPALRPAEDGSPGLSNQRKGDSSDLTKGQDSASGTGGIVQVRKLLLIR